MWDGDMDCFSFSVIQNEAFLSMFFQNASKIMIPAKLMRMAIPYWRALKFVIISMCCICTKRRNISVAPLLPTMVNVSLSIQNSLRTVVFLMLENIRFVSKVYKALLFPTINFNCPLLGDSCALQKSAHR